MGTPILDPTLPADNSPIVAGELRGQFQAIQNRFDNSAQTQQLGLTVSNPPTQAEVQAFALPFDLHCLLCSALTPLPSDINESQKSNPSEAPGNRPSLADGEFASRH
jgi:hypothetical protein